MSKRSLRVLLIMVICIPLSCSSGERNVEKPRVLMKDALTDLMVIDKSASIVNYMQELKLRKATVVKVSANIDLPPLQETGKNDIAADKYLLKAAKAGLIKRIYWVIPYTTLEYADVERRVMLLLARMMPDLKSGTIDKFVYKNGCTSGKISGIELILCNSRSLPHLEDPVFLDLDANFFVPFSDEKRITKLKGFVTLWNDLAVKGIKISGAVVTFTPFEGAKPYHEYLKDHARTVLKNPAVLKDANPPELWSVLDNADTMLSAEDVKGAKAYLRPFLNKYGQEKAFCQIYETAGGKRD